MYILLLGDYYFPHYGGIENSLFCISKALSNRGFASIILAAHEDGDERKQSGEVAKVERVDFKEINTICDFYFPRKGVQKKIAVIRHRIEEIIQLYGTPKGVITRSVIMSQVMTAYFSEIPCVYVPPVVNKFNLKLIVKNGIKGYFLGFRNYYADWVYSKIQIIVFQRIQHVVVFSRNMKDQVLESTSGIDRDKIHVVYPGVHDKFYDNHGYEYKPEKGYVSFLFVGRLVEDKNLKMLITALSALKEAWQLVIVGDGPNESELKKQVRELNIAERVVFAGKRSDSERFYSKADYFVLPSSYEAFGQVIIESLVSGTPVIGFSSIENQTRTAIEELVKDNETGFVCREFTEICLAENLQKACDVFFREYDYMIMRKKCRTEALNKYSWICFTDKCMELLEYS